MARRQRPAPEPAPALPGQGDDLDALLQSLMQASTTTTPRRWKPVFEYLADLQRSAPQPLANPLLIPLA